MHASEINEGVITDLIHSLYSPQPSSHSKGDSIRSLLSPALVVDFPLLPAQQQTKNAPPVTSKHSRSAQALSLFRVPSVLVNAVPGASWTLDVLSVVKDAARGEREGAREQWRAQVEWSLSAGVHVPLFGRHALERKTTREVVLEFVPKAEVLGDGSDDSETQREREARVTSIDIEDEEESLIASELLAHSIAGSSHSIFEGGRGFGELEATAEAELVLRRASYSGIDVPESIQNMTGFNAVAHVAPRALDLCLGPAYGVLLLLGLDASTRSLAPSAQGRQKQKAREERRRSSTTSSKQKSTSSTKASSGSHKNKSHRARDTASSASRALERTSSIASSDSGGSDLDPHWDLGAPESAYHQAMRLLRVRLGQVTALEQYLAKAPRQAGLELRDLLRAIRGVVLWAVEMVMSLLGVRWAEIERGRDAGECNLIDTAASAKGHSRSGTHLSTTSAVRSPVATPQAVHIKRVSFASSPSRSLPSSPSRSAFGPVPPPRSNEFESPERKQIRGFFSPVKIQGSQHPRKESSAASVSSNTGAKASDAGKTPPRPQIHHKKSSDDLATQFKKEEATDELSPDSPSEMEKTQMNSVLGEIEGFKRRASLAGEEEDKLLVPHQTALAGPAPSKEIKEHKRELSKSIQKLWEADLQLSTAQSSDDSPSMLPTLSPSAIKQLMTVAERNNEVFEKDDKSEQVMIEDVTDEMTETEVDVEADEEQIEVEPVPLAERPLSFPGRQPLTATESASSASSKESALEAPLVANQPQLTEQLTAGSQAQLGSRAGGGSEQGRTASGAHATDYGLLTDQAPFIPPLTDPGAAPLGLRSDEAEQEAQQIADAAEAKSRQAPAEEVQAGIRGLMSPTLSASRAAQFEELLKNASFPSPSLGSGGGVSATSAPVQPGPAQRGMPMPVPPGWIPVRKEWEREEDAPISAGMNRESSGSSWSSQGYNTAAPDLRRTWSAGTPNSDVTQFKAAAAEREREKEKGGVHVGPLPSAEQGKIDQEKALERDLSQVDDPAVADLFRGQQAEDVKEVGGKKGKRKLGLDIHGVEQPKEDDDHHHDDDAGVRKDSERSGSFPPFNTAPNRVRAGDPGAAAQGLAIEEDEVSRLEEAVSTAVSDETRASANTPGTTPSSSPQRTTKEHTSPRAGKGNHKGKAALAKLSPLTSPTTSPRMTQSAKLHGAGHAKEESGASAVSHQSATSAQSAQEKKEQRSPPKHKKKNKGGKKKGSAW